jgi:hypothetical protein
MASSINNDWINTSVLPPDILSLQNYDFFRVVEKLAGDIVAELLRIQAIRNVRTFMLVPDVLDVFKINAYELQQIKSRACFQLENNDYIVKIGIKISLEYLRELFEMKINEQYPDLSFRPIHSLSNKRRCK